MADAADRWDAQPLTPRKLKALAHPIRYQLVELLSTEGPSTASALGRRIGESSGTTSYHLRQLAEAELIWEDPDRGTARDRWWRSAGGWSLGEELMQSPDNRAEVDAVLDEAGRVRWGRLRRWHAERDRWPKPWREASMIANNRFALTVDELQALGAELHEVVARYRSLHDRDDPPPGTAQVVVQTDVFPIGDPPEA